MNPWLPKIWLASLVAAATLSVTVPACATDPGAPPPMQAHVSGAIHWPGNKAQIFFSDGTYVRYDIKADRGDAGYPQAVTNKTWPGLAPYADRIIAGVDGPKGKAYLFLTGGEYVRYDVTADRVDDGYPKPIDNGTWPGLGPYAKSLLAAVNWPDGKIQFFLSDGTYIRYDIAADRADPGYPQPIDGKTWPGVAPFKAQLAGMIGWSGKIYMFLDTGDYLRYDIASDHLDAGYPKPVDARNWPGLAR